MIELHTLLRNQDGTFVGLDEYAEPPPDRNYIEGAIQLTINWVAILDEQHWDYIDQLWLYIADMVVDIRTSRHAYTYFPDYPLRLSFERIDPGHILVSVAVRGGPRKCAARAQESELLRALASAGVSFFQKMQRLVPGRRGSYTEAIQKLEAAANSNEPT